jgi:cytochrome c556
MIRTIVTMVAVAVGVTAVLAQGDPIAIRKALMKENNQHHKTIRTMLKGGEFDAAKVNTAFNQWDDTAKQLPKLFPDNSKDDPDGRALPAIWENRKDFEEKIAAFAKAVSAGKGKIKSAEDLKSAFAAVDGTCDTCHERYRGPPRKKK